jgi:putative DNA primase/helicase
MSRDRDIDLATASRMLTFIDCEDRDQWLAVGMALKREFGEAAFHAFDAWSQGSEKYQPRACVAVWRSIKPVARGYSIASVVKWATDRGFRFDENTARVVSPDELERRRAEREARERAAEQERELSIQAACDRASETWQRAATEGVSPYLVRKGIAQPEGVRFSDDWLIVPMMRYDLPETHALRGVQIIKPSGEKRFTSGMAKTERYGEQTRGVACALALPPDEGYDGPIMIGEGYATCASARAASGFLFPTFAGFDKGGLLPAARMIRALWPKSALFFLADDDYLTVGNPGVTAAKKAVGSLKRATWMKPHFQKARDGATDFNDLHMREGLGAVTAQIVPPLRLIARGKV